VKQPQKQKRPVTSKKKPAAKAGLSHHVKQTLVPRKGNQFRPHLVRPSGLTLVLALIVIAQFTYSFATTGGIQVLGRISDVDTPGLLQKTNDQRVEEGLAPLVTNDQLNKAAYLKAQDMIQNNYWAHTSPNGTTPWKWLADVDYNYSVAGENLAKNYPTSAATVEAWMNSPSHRDNIMNSSYTQVGFATIDGTLEGRPTSLVVAFYGTPSTATAVNGETTSAQVFAAAPIGSGSTPVGYFASAAQSLSPVSIIALGILAIVAIVAVAAHQYRQKLPMGWRKSWKLHHGLYTFGGMIVLGILIVLATGGGQI